MPVPTRLRRLPSFAPDGSGETHNPVGFNASLFVQRDVGRGAPEKPKRYADDAETSNRPDDAGDHRVVGEDDRESRIRSGQSRSKFAAGLERQPYICGTTCLCPKRWESWGTQFICKRPYGRVAESDGSVGFVRKSTGMRPAGLITLKEERLTRGKIQPRRKRKLKS
jgi:hypothetical protein